MPFLIYDLRVKPERGGTLPERRSEVARAAMGARTFTHLHENAKRNGRVEGAKE